MTHQLTTAEVDSGVTHALGLLTKTRQTMLNTIAGLSDTQLVEMPNGFGNNILWNFGHLIVSQQFLTYQLAGLEVNVSDDWQTRFIEGSSPKDWPDNNVDLDSLREQSLSLVTQTQQDWAAGKFDNLTQTQFPYTTSFGGQLTSVSEAIHYNNFHEGVHFSVLRTIKRLNTAK
ncbi:MAG: DinB family protein [Deinococcota bacterium]